MSNSLPSKLELKHPEGRELLGGDLLAQCLHALGARVAFGVHGGHLDSFLMGCVDVGIELVDTRHETVGIQAAEGYAKVSGKTGLCFATANSGFSNALPGLATALADHSPIFCVTSSAPLRDALTNALQDYHDQIVIARPLTKFAHRITTVTEIPRLVSLAWRHATAGAPGPVLLDFPIDILFTPVEVERVSWGSIIAPMPRAPGPDPWAVREVLELLRSSVRPAIIIGTGAQSAVSPLIEFTNSTHIPIFHTPKHSTTLPRNHPYNAGPAPSLAILALQKQEPPDVVVLLGARTGWLLGGRSGMIVPNDVQKTRIVQVDGDAGEIGRSEYVHLGIVADTSLFLDALNATLQTSSAPYTAPESWVSTAVSLQNIRNPENEAEPVLCGQTGHLHPYHGLRAALQGLPPKSILSVDGGEAGGWALQLLPQVKNVGLSLLPTGYMGFLGTGWGYSLGAAVASSTSSASSSSSSNGSGDTNGAQKEGGDIWVVNLQGDGSAGFHISTLDTFAKFNLKVLTLIVNNECWGMSRAGQDILYNTSTPHRPISSLRRETRYDIVAQGFGCTGLIVDATTDSDGKDGEKMLGKVKGAVEKIVREGKAAVLDLRVSKYPVHAATKGMMGGTVGGGEEIVVPYYDNLPRPYYKKKG
ncbi:acetolactate synthase I/II/III large subunit [Dendryphion nanum]|uniref:Acetolactate synthase I/II/III large subunit n=1 Tax=Dendryphion nanum TaxID=256645 RepID=A0A9P9E8B4_9PLEO|nr:acetolactate synthase I/II/III large subunit [Dendryphion nanum]